MKLNGFVGKGTGKLGSSVFAISGGEQIVREYNPNVSNPSTDAQVAQRAKLKLMSQIAASLSPALAFKKDGLVSARNQFVSKNIALCSFENDKADVDVTSISLTPRDTYKCPLTVRNLQDGGHSVQVSIPAGANFEKIIVVEVGRNNDDTISVMNITAADVDAQDRVEVPLEYLGAGDYCAVYGIKFNGQANRAKFDNYYMETAANDAVLEINRALAISNGDAFGTAWAPVAS